MKKDKTDKTISKFMSLVLRHDPDKINLNINRAGWVDIDPLIKGMQSNGFKDLTFEDISRVVAESDKSRFQIDFSRMKIRACQGHSIDVDLDLTQERPPELLYHGTASRNLDSIFSKGILKMDRHHVHLSGDWQTAKSVGNRHGKSVVLPVNAQKMHEDGNVFYLSQNKVWLTDCVPVSYLQPPMEPPF